MITATACDTHVEQLFERVRQLHEILTSAGIPHRLVGGMAVFFHVSSRDPLRARLTADIDAAVDRSHLAGIIAIAGTAGLTYRQVAGIDTLVDAARPGARSAIHMVFLNEKVRPEYAAEVPSSPPTRTVEGIYLASVGDLVRMKLTSYRLKDRVHIQDLDGVGLITPEIEDELPELLRARLAEVRASE